MAVAERVRLERALQFATKRCDGVSEAVTRFLASISAPPLLWKSEYLTEADGSLVPIPTKTPQQFPTNATAVYIIPYNNEPLVFRAYAETVIEVPTGHQIFPSFGETDFITRFPVRIDLHKDEWVFAPTFCMAVVTSEDDLASKSYPSLVLKHDDILKTKKWSRVQSNDKYELLVMEDPAKTNYRWWEQGDFSLVQQVYDNAKRYLMISSSETKPLITIQEEPTSIESPMHYLSWGDHASTAVLIAWMRKTGRGYIACVNEYFRFQIGGVAAYIKSNGTGYNLFEHYYMPAWPPTFLIKIVRSGAQTYAPLPFTLRHVSENVYELPLWPKMPWLYHPQSDEMNEASNVLLQLADPSKGLCDNTADFDQGSLPEYARQKLEFMSGYYEHYEDGARSFYL